MHIIKSPFMCRNNQFGNGKELAFGIDLKTLLKEEIHSFILGKKEYYGNSKEVIQFAYQWKSVWKNKKGKEVCILPLRIFNIKGGTDEIDG